MINYNEAIELIKANVIKLESEQVSVLEATNRFLDEDIKADRNYPPFNRSAMDGYAVNSEWYNALDKKAIVNQGTCFAGQAFEKKIDRSKVLKIMTGAPVPEGLDAVIKIEECHGGCDLIEFEPGSVSPFQNIAKEGEDASEGNVVLTNGTHLTPNNLQVLATLGVEKVLVKKTPTVSIITTGDEVKDLEEKVNWFQIRNSNKYSLLSSLKGLNIDVKTCIHVLDHETDIEKEIKKALQSDLILLTGGVSMGDADFVPSLLSKNGVNKVFHKIAMKPGKPVWFGKNERTAVFGLPGNPLSTFHCFHLLVKPFIELLQGGKSINKPVLIPTFSDIKPARIDRFFPFTIKDGKAEVKLFNGSGDITASQNTNGIVFLPKETSIKADELVKCRFY